MTAVASLLASHLTLVLVALIAACAISVPLAIAVAGRPRIAAPVVAIAGVIQTIPGLALLAVMVAILASTHGLGLDLSPFGFPPAVIALTLYAILPILRNAITGLRGVDAATVEAGRGIGMTGGQLLRHVQLPLAAPVIAAGIRTATVWTVGAATLATPVGQACLGNLIFAGLQTRNWQMLLSGVVAAAGLAIALDLILGGVERALVRRRRSWPPLAALVALVLVVELVLPRVGGGEDTGAVVAAPTAAQAITRVRLGGKTFTEQYILVEVLRQRLARAGIAVDVVAGLGSTVAFDALVGKEIDAYVEYTGTVWSTQMKRAPGTAAWQVRVEVECWLAREHGIRSLGSLGFENAYALAVTRATAVRLGLREIGDLAPHASRMAIGGDYEWFGRPEWSALRAAYGLTFARTTTFDPALLYDAAARGEADVISAFSSDGRIAADDLVTLADPRGSLPPYDALLLLGPRIAADPQVICALGPLRGKLDLALVRRANLMVDRAADKQTPAAAATWLIEQAHLEETCR